MCMYVCVFFKYSFPFLCPSNIYPSIPMHYYYVCTMRSGVVTRPMHTRSRKITTSDSWSFYNKLFILNSLFCCFLLHFSLLHINCLLVSESKGIITIILLLNINLVRYSLIFMLIVAQLNFLLNAAMLAYLVQMHQGHYS